VIAPPGREPGGAGGVTRRFTGATKSIYLTFDDGPDPHWTPRVLAVLERHRAHATFFVVGQLVRRFAPLLREAHAAGHAIGNHAWSHRHPWSLDRARARHEVRAGADAVAQALGHRTGWFRPAHGRLSPWLVDAVRAEQQRIALWSVSALDWGPFGVPERIVHRLVAAGAGDIALLHDGPWLQNRPASTVRALPAVLQRLQQDDLRPMPLPDATLAA
jgi:peptidoglycan-N-acetylglucosamine deacetylase